MSASTVAPDAARQRLNRIRSHSRYLAHVALLMACVFPLLAVAAAMFTLPQQLASQIGLAWPSNAQFGGGQRLLLVLVALLPAATGGVALLCLRRCLQQFAHGEFFSSVAIRGLRGFAGYSALSVLLGIIGASAASVILSWGFGPGQRALQLGIGSPQLSALFFAGTVWLIAVVMSEARRLAEENAQFV